MIHALIPALALVLISVLGLTISLLFRRFNFYKHSSIENNPHMKKLGITCVKHDELSCTSESDGCEGCSCAINP
jgi:hypothetical protein